MNPINFTSLFNKLSRLLASASAHGSNTLSTNEWQQSQTISYSVNRLLLFLFFLLLLFFFLFRFSLRSSIANILQATMMYVAVSAAVDFHRVQQMKRFISSIHACVCVCGGCNVQIFVPSEFSRYSTLAELADGYRELQRNCVGAVFVHYCATAARPIWLD